MEKTVFVDECGENQLLYRNVKGLYGGWIMTTTGNPTCLEECEELKANDVIEFVNKTFSSKVTVWEECNERDYKYTNDWVEFWLDEWVRSW